MAYSERDRLAGKFKLYNEEKRREEAANQTIHDLHLCTTDLTQKRLRAIEKLFDVVVKDEVADTRLASDPFSRAPPPSSKALVREARDCLYEATRDRVEAIPTEVFRAEGLGFMQALEEMTRADQSVDVRRIVERHVQPHLRAIDEKHKSSPDETAKVLDDTIRKHANELVEEARGKAIKSVYEDVDSRLKRVKAAKQRVRRNLGDLAVLLSLPPTPLVDSEGMPRSKAAGVVADTHGATERDLAALRAEYLAIAAEERELTEQMNAVNERVLAQRRGLEDQVLKKETELEGAEEEIDRADERVSEALANAAPETGRWDSAREELTRKMAVASEEEARVRAEYAKLRQRSEALEAEENDLKARVSAQAEQLAALVKRRDDTTARRTSAADAAIRRLEAMEAAAAAAEQELNRAAEGKLEALREGAIRRWTLRTQLHAMDSLHRAEASAQQAFAGREEATRQQLDQLMLESYEARQARQAMLSRLEQQLAETEEAFHHTLHELIDVRTVRLSRSVLQADPPDLVQRNLEAEKAKFQQLSLDTADTLARIEATTALNNKRVDQWLDRIGHIEVVSHALQNVGADPERSDDAELNGHVADLRAKLADIIQRKRRIDNLRVILEERVVGVVSVSKLGWATRHWGAQGYHKISPGRVFAQRKVLATPPKAVQRPDFEPVKTARVPLKSNTAQTSAALAASYRETVFGGSRTQSRGRGRPETARPMVDTTLATPAPSMPTPPSHPAPLAPYAIAPPASASPPRGPRSRQAELIEQRLAQFPTTHQRISRIAEEAEQLAAASDQALAPNPLSPALAAAATAANQKLSEQRTPSPLLHSSRPHAPSTPPQHPTRSREATRGPSWGGSPGRGSHSHPRSYTPPSPKTYTPEVEADDRYRAPPTHPLRPETGRILSLGSPGGRPRGDGETASRVLSQYASGVRSQRPSTGPSGGGGLEYGASAHNGGGGGRGVYDEGGGGHGDGGGGGTDSYTLPTLSDHTYSPATADRSNPALSSISCFHVGAASVVDLQRVVREQQAMLSVFFERVSTADSHAAELAAALQQAKLKANMLRDELTETEAARQACEQQLDEFRNTVADLRKEQSQFTAAVNDEVSRRLEGRLGADAAWGDSVGKSSLQRDLAAKDEMIRALHSDLVRWRARALDSARTAAGVRALSPGAEGSATRNDMNFGGSTAVGTVSPFGRVTLVFTDIQGSTQLWDHSQDWMASAQFLHDAAVRALILQHDGYEVKTVGDAFMVAFQSPAKAVKFGIAVQHGLLQVTWPAIRGKLPEEVQKFLEVETVHNEKLWCGLRVRVGIHVGEPLLHADPKTGRMDYYGPAVNTAARVESAASGGYVMVSEAVVRELDSQGLTLDELGAAWRVEEGVVLKGVAGGPHTLYCCVPRGLMKRLEQLPQRDAGKPPAGEAPLDSVLVHSSGVAPPVGWCAVVHLYVSPHYGQLRSDASVSGVLEETASALIADARSKLGDFRGFLVSARDGAISVVFHGCTSALHWALDVQAAAMELRTPNALLSHPLTSAVQFRGQVVLRGLVPSAGVVLAELEPTARGGYTSPALDDAAELARSARPGEILITQSVYRSIRDDLRLLKQPSCKPFRSLPLGGESVEAVSVLPAEYGFRRMVPPYRPTGGTPFCRPLLTMQSLADTLPVTDISTVSAQLQVAVSSALRSRRHAQLANAARSFECAMMALHDRPDESMYDAADEDEEGRASDDAVSAAADSRVAFTPSVVSPKGGTLSRKGAHHDAVHDDVTVTISVAELLLAVHNAVVALHSLSNRTVEPESVSTNEALEALQHTHRAVRGFADLIRTGVLRPAEGGALPISDDEFQRRFLEFLPPSEAQENRKAAGTMAVSVRARRKEVWHETVAYAVETEAMELRIAHAPVKLRRSVGGLLARLYVHVKSVARRATIGGYVAGASPRRSGMPDVGDNESAIVTATPSVAGGVGGTERSAEARDGRAPSSQALTRGDSMIQDRASSASGRKRSGSMRGGSQSASAVTGASRGGGA